MELAPPTALPGAPLIPLSLPVVGTCLCETGVGGVGEVGRELGNRVELQHRG